MPRANTAATTSLSAYAIFYPQNLNKSSTIFTNYDASNYTSSLASSSARINPSKLPLRNHSSPPITSNLINGRTGLQVTARTAGAAKTIEVEVDKPLGLTLGQKSGGGVVITGVEGGGNAAKAGLKAGDQVLYTSSFFGDELWPADKLGGAEVDVKRLPKRPAPPRFGRKLTETQKACFFSFFFPSMLEQLTYALIVDSYTPCRNLLMIRHPDAYVCPQCRAPKKRFTRYDVNTGRAVGGGLPPIGVIIGLVAGIGGIGALLVYGLQ
uniref:PDZ domain-containing protein n=1 Tax=Salix viminalis TaxID=40686 RepID=A0A6N2LJR7_SALVM